MYCHKHPCRLPTTPSLNRAFLLLLFSLSWLSFAVVVRAEDEAASTPDTEEAVALEKPGFGSKLLWYVPNRLLDFVDMVRLRLRVGPGLAVGLHATDYVWFYGGAYRSGFVGLPGPREGAQIRYPLGWEKDRGMVFFGIDATDDTPHDPGYSSTEITLGAQLLVLGLDAGFDPAEIGDFLGGLLLFDPAGDDFGRGNPAYQPDRLHSVWQEVKEKKPAKFDNFDDRMEYTRTTFNWGLDTGVREVDTMFAKSPERTLDAPPSRFRFGMYTEFEVDKGFSMSFDPDFDVQIEMPNIESRWDLYITGRDVDELPGTDPSERDGGANVGIRRYSDWLPIELNAGVKVKWLPEVFASAVWRKDFHPGSWRMVPQVRGYFESEDGLGSIASLFAQRWMGSRERNFFRSSTSGKWTEISEGFEWEQNLYLGHVLRMIDTSRREGAFRAHDTAQAFGVRGTVNGHIDSNDALDRYRLSFAYRCPLYRDWIFLEVIPELEWRNYNDWDTVPILRIGFDALFWGPGVGQRS